MKQLTKAEEQVMQILWDLKEAVVKQVVDKFNDPKPAYTTVATVLKVLQTKNIICSRKIGKTNLFSPLITKKEYTKFQFTSLLKNYFNGSFPQMATFFAKENNLSIEDLERLLKDTEDQDKNTKL